jgi:hypothetical protein
MLKSILGTPAPTAKEAREERAALKAYRAKEVQALKDIRAGLAAEPAAKVAKQDAERLETRIAALIADIQAKPEAEADLLLEAAKPEIESLRSSLPRRAAMMEVRLSLGSAAAAKPAAMDEKTHTALQPYLTKYAGKIDSWLAAKENYWLGPDAVSAALAALGREAVTDVGAAGYMTSTTYIGGLFRLSAQEIQAAATAPQVIKAMKYEGPSPVKLGLSVFLGTLVVAVATAGGMLAANDAIFRPLPFRLLNFIYGTAFFFITLPFYFVRWLRGTAPKYYSLLPLYPIATAPQGTLARIAANFFSYVEDDYFRGARDIWLAQRREMV